MTALDIRDTILSSIEVLAWPTFGVLVIVLLRPHLLKLISLIETVRYKGLELNFKEVVQEVTEKAESLPAVSKSLVVEPLPETIDHDPRITILKSWASVERAIEDFARMYRKDLGRLDRMSTRRRVQVLNDAKLIDDTLASVLYEMGGVRNLIAHGRDIALDSDTVYEFSRASARLTSIIDDQLRSGDHDNEGSSSTD